MANVRYQILPFFYLPVKKSKSTLIRLKAFLRYIPPKNPTVQGLMVSGCSYSIILLDKPFDIATFMLKIGIPINYMVS